MSDTGWLCLMAMVIMGGAFVAGSVDKQAVYECRTAAVKAAASSTLTFEQLSNLCEK